MTSQWFLKTGILQHYLPPKEIITILLILYLGFLVNFLKVVKLIWKNLVKLIYKYNFMVERENLYWAYLIFGYYIKRTAKGIRKWHSSYTLSQWEERKQCLQRRGWRVKRALTFCCRLMQWKDPYTEILLAPQLCEMGSINFLSFHFTSL